MYYHYQPGSNIFIVYCKHITHARVHTLTRAHACAHTCAHTCTHVHTRAHTCTHVLTRAHTCTHVHTRAHTCTHVHTRAHTCTHVHIRVHTQPSPSPPSPSAAQAIAIRWRPTNRDGPLRLRQCRSLAIQINTRTGDPIHQGFGSFSRIKKLLRRTEMRTRDRIYCQTLRTVRDISRDDRARIATSSLRTLTDRQT